MTVRIGIEWEIASTPSDETYNFLESHNWKLDSDPTIRINNRLQSRTEFKTTTPYTIDLNDIKSAEERIINDFKALKSTLTNLHVNSSMGIHIHFSGLPKKTCIFSKEFFEHVQKEYTKIAKSQLEKQRLIPGATYNDWIYNKAGNIRRSAINYRGAYAKWKTIELRFLPSTDKVSEFRKYIKLVLKLLKYVNDKNYPGATFKAEDNNETEKQEYKVLI